MAIAANDCVDRKNSSDHFPLLWGNPVPLCIDATVIIKMDHKEKRVQVVACVGRQKAYKRNIPGELATRSAT